MDNYISGYMDLLMLWMPEERSGLLYSLYNDIFYRGYLYYRDCPENVINHVKSVNPNLAAKQPFFYSPGEWLLVYHFEQFRRKGGFELVREMLARKKPVSTGFFSQ